MASGRVPKTDITLSLVIFDLRCISIGVLSLVLMVVMIVVSENKEPYTAGNGKCHDCENRPCETGGVQDHCRQTENCGQRIENRNCLLLVKTHVYKLVVEMTAVGVEGTLTLCGSSYNREYGVEKGNRQCKHGNYEGYDGIELKHADYGYG